MHRLRGWHLVAIAAALTVIAAAGLFYFLKRGPEPKEMLGRLPGGNAAIVRVDFAALRGAGLLEALAGGKADQEPEYKTFVDKTRFDYARDLDAAWISFHQDGTFMLLAGRFDWARLEAYAKEQGGGCFNGLCRMQGSKPERKISYFLVRGGVLALAVSADGWAASRMNEARPLAAGVEPSRDPVWVWLPRERLARADSFPAGTVQFARALEGAENVTLTAGASAGGAFQVRLDALCRDESQAQVVESALTKLTGVLREMIAKEGLAPKPEDFAGVLIKGTFTRAGRRVEGKWPVEQAFVNALTGKP